MPRTPVAIFDVDTTLIEALESALGPPIDSYLMGWQVWLVDAEEPQGLTLEYRLHPPAGFEMPAGFDHHDLWDAVVTQLAEGADRVTLAQDTRALGEIWDLLEVYAAFYDDAPSADDIRRRAEEALGVACGAFGEVDHERLGGRWRRQRHQFDLPNALREALG